MAPSTPSRSSVAMLVALNATGRHIYAGTVDPEVVRARRAANKRARDARRGRPVRTGRAGTEAKVYARRLATAARSGTARARRTVEALS